MNNIDQIKARLSGAEIDAILITSPVNRRYATGFSSSAGALLVSADGAWFFTDSRFIEAAGNAIENASVLVVDGGHSYSGRLNEIMSEQGYENVGFEESGVTYSEFVAWNAKLNAKLTPAQKILNGLRAVKSDEELEKMIGAQRIAEKAFEDLLPLISTDITERELATALTCLCLKNGADDKSFDPIVVSGARSSMPHGEPTDERIQKGFLTIDFGVKKDGWCSDTTRTLSIGLPTDEMRSVYDIVLEAQLAGIDAAKAGACGSEIDGAAREVIGKYGYGDYFGHAFGHGLGLEIHEEPNASPSNTALMPRGAVISAEPGIYIPGKFGVRIEDVLSIDENGNKNITHITKSLVVI